VTLASMGALLRACLCFAALSACVTTMPTGARPLLAEGYEPFVRGAPVRALPPEEDAPVALTVASGARARLVDTARGLIGRRHLEVNGQRFGDDCTGLVRAAFSQVGVDVMSAATAEDNGVTAIYRFATRHGRVYEGGRPVGGDLVFFRDTWDFNGDGRANDGLTHVGLVEDVAEDGTVTVIHRVARGVVRYRMNLSHPTLARDTGGRVINDYLKVAGPTSGPLLTAQLFAGYATVLPVEPRYAGR
jgi:hypothetical protein